MNKPEFTEEQVYSIMDTFEGTHKYLSKINPEFYSPLFYRLKSEFLGRLMAKTIIFEEAKNESA